MKRKAQAARHNLALVWKSNGCKVKKRRLFTATVESVLLYGSETRTQTRRQHQTVYGCYTRMLRMALNVNWYVMRMTNSVLYYPLPQANSKVTQRILRLAGHAFPHYELTLHSAHLWERLHGNTSRGRPKTTFVDVLRSDVGLQGTWDIAALMGDAYCWKELGAWSCFSGVLLTNL